MIGGIHAGTAAHLQLGPGMLLRDLPVDTARNVDELRQLLRDAVTHQRGLLGATRGGGSFRGVPALRELDADGARNPFVGGTFCDGWQVRLTGTLIEVTPENMTLLLALGDVVQDGALTTVTARAAVSPEDYVRSLCWVGTTSRGLVLIELQGALNMSGATLTIRDKGEGSMPFNFLAHALSPDDQETAPFRIIFFDEQAD